MEENKPLEEWTLKECKELCEVTLDCPNCPLARVCGENGFGIPEGWRIGGVADMARGRQQKWICLDCNSGFSVQGAAPKICCFCGSGNIGRAPSVELVKTFAEKRAELEDVCERLNPVYAEFLELKRKRDSIMAYWKQQKRRGYISTEEYDALDSLFEGTKDRKEAE